MLAYIKDKMKARMPSWFSRTLSLGGKEVLLKAVALSMLVYVMSCFKLPRDACESLTSAMADFWWNSLEEKRKVHWLSWEKHVCQRRMEDLALETYNASIKLY